MNLLNLKRSFIISNTTFGLELPSISEFFAGIKEELCRGMYEGLKESVIEMFSGMMDIMNVQINNSRNMVTQSPEEWNSAAYSFIKGISEDAFIPISACIIIFVFAWELIHVVQEDNQMSGGIDKFLFTIVKLFVCLVVCSKSFDIVMGLFGIASFAAERAASGATDTSITTNINSLFQDPEVYEFSCVFAMLGNYMITWICKNFTYVISVMIFLRVQLWFLELFIYAVPSPLPFATFLNKEWGQTGQNYLRKIFAVCLEGTFMLVAFGLYKFLILNVTGTGLLSSEDFMVAMCMSLGCGVILFILLLKVGNISSSILNAH